MKKIFKGIICAGICASFALTGLAGCKSNSAHRDPETDPLKLAIGPTDGNFNPLFYTSANDGSIANLTQISLMTADADGKLAYGENYPTVALDYKETYYSDKEGTAVSENGDVNGSTSFEFVIKNGIKFSDGEPLTVMDVLFNLYVYLDPFYSGSATIYSTKIQGLQNYRRQDTSENLGYIDESLTQYYARAQAHIDNLIAWSKREMSPSNEMIKDLKTVKKLYKQELESDWNNISTTWEDTYKDYNFTAAWQAFCFAEGVIDTQKYINEKNNEADRFYDANNNGEKDDGEKYLTDFDPEFPQSVKEAPLNTDPATVNYPVSSTGANLKKEVNAAVTSADIDKFVAENEGYSREDAELVLQGRFLVNHVLTSRAGAYKETTPDDDKTYPEDTDIGDDIEFVLNFCATGEKAFDEFVKVERESGKGQELLVTSISGITVRKDNKFNGKDLGEDHDILKIMIDGVDPKAKWNFSFAVAPMHYYSSEALTKAAMEDYNNGNLYKGTATHFGVEYKSSDFMNDILANSTKTNLPVGAGPYKACSYKMNDEQVTGGNFHYNKVCYYERNENFTTVGKGIDNAKIKYVTYREMADDKIVSALKANDIDYGTPIAKSTNQKEVKTGNLKQTTYQTGGYGYVGINPKSPELRSVFVRQAIMYALDTSSISDYYGQELVSLINRPMSLTSWASPENPKYTTKEQRPDRYYEMTETVLGGKSEEQFIRGLVDMSGNYKYDANDGKIKAWDGNSYGGQLELTFTIAGESTDHPSYNMFIRAKELLERCGFKINVEHSALALKLLTTGDLQVWAAAWSSSIDPDPYQIYSMYSNASSTKNWYKTGIERDAGSDSYGLAYEYRIANALTAKIEDGREKLKEQDRRNIYGVSSTTEKLSAAIIDEYGTIDDAKFDSILDKLCCLDLIMEMAVEFPTYQRNELCVYNSAVLDESTMRINDASYNMGPIDELWKVGYLK